MKRRRVLRGLGAGSLILLAGCGGGGDGGTATADPTTAPDTPQPTTDPSTPTPTTAAPTDPPASPTPTPSDVPALDDRIQFESRHRTRIEMSDYRGEDLAAVITGRWIEGEFTYTVEWGNKVAQWVRVDGETTVFFETQCFTPSRYTGPVYDGRLWGDPERTVEQLDLYQSASALRTDQYDRERMYVYEVDVSAGGVEGPVEYWISALTGYPRRVLADGLEAEYWEWGRVFEPIRSQC